MLVKAGEIIPSDGEVVEGVATVDESAITGESAPVIRESGGDREFRHRWHYGFVGLVAHQNHGATRRNVYGPHDHAC